MNASGIISRDTLPGERAKPSRIHLTGCELSGRAHIKVPYLLRSRAGCRMGAVSTGALRLLLIDIDQFGDFLGQLAEVHSREVEHLRTVVIEAKRKLVVDTPRLVIRPLDFG